MPVLTVEQVVEAIFELPIDEQAEVIEQIRAGTPPLKLKEVRKDTFRTEMAAHDGYSCISKRNSMA